ncbi:unnamed protein product [Spirodela intermedia]|uniref:Uncharacterized protein n=1 Tax=Spirodela intermedia TaxID=51605 RepID=A0A7I8JQT1_SPIIN|nr:unnamed protein product [Spirodela intermedia]CAA6672131.1 unnamed protein product [Spirodela intermedia]
MAPFLIGAWSVPGNRLRGFFYLSRRQLSCKARPFLKAVVRRYQWAAASADPFLLLLMFFVANSFVGFLLLMKLGPKPGRVGTGDLDLFFTAVSRQRCRASWQYSVSTTQMEAFSRGQVFVLILLMLTGGEGFTSLLLYHLNKAKITRENRKADPAMNIGEDVSISIALELPISGRRPWHIRLRCGVHFSGFAAIVIYLAFFAASEAREVLTNKGIHIGTSPSSSPCLPSQTVDLSSQTRTCFHLEKVRPLVLIIPLTPLAGKLSATVLPTWPEVGALELGTSSQEKTRNSRRLADPERRTASRLRSFVWEAPLRTPRPHHSGVDRRSIHHFVCLEWDSDVLRGSDLSTWQKAAASVFDMSVISPAILVLYVVPPPYTSVSPEEDEISVGQRRGGRRSSDLLWILTRAGGCVCMRSAYGNVGLSMGYSCGRRLKEDRSCKDGWYGFAGRWSNGGKMILIGAMVVGRLKRFNKRGGSAWKLT